MHQLAKQSRSRTSARCVKPICSCRAFASSDNVLRSLWSLAPWSFVLKPGTKSLLPPWLSITPTSGLVIPGERATVTLTIHVTSAAASSLNFPLPSAEEALSDLFVLSIEKKDLFLAVSSRSYQPSVFGSSLEHLARLRKPIKASSIEERQQIASVIESLSKTESERSEEEKRNVEAVGKAGVPRSIHQLVNFLAENALAVEDVFSEDGDLEMMKLVKESLDTVSSSPDVRPLPVTYQASNRRVGRRSASRTTRSCDTAGKDIKSGGGRQATHSRCGRSARTTRERHRLSLTRRYCNPSRPTSQAHSRRSRQTKFGDSLGRRLSPRFTQ
jgi:hypothetical protein